MENLKSAFKYNAAYFAKPSDIQVGECLEKSANRQTRWESLGKLSYLSSVFVPLHLATSYKSNYHTAKNCVGNIFMFVFRNGF